MKNEMDFGKGLHEGGDHRRQRISRLRVRGRDSELPLISVCELLAQPLDISNVQENTVDDLGKFPTRIGQAQQTLPLADELLEAEFVLQVLDVLADP